MEHIATAALGRIERCTDRILNTLELARSGRSLAAEPDEARAIARIQARTGMNAKAALLAHEGLMTPMRKGVRERPERIQGATIDFVGVAFLERGWHAARAVGRVAYRDGRAQGSGFLIAPGIFMTNNHVIGSQQTSAQFVVEFDYELDRDGKPANVTRFAFAPENLFVTDDTDDLDYTVIAVGSKISGNGELHEYGYCPLSGAGDKHTLGELANVVQHPQGRFKEVVIRENQLVSRLSHVLHYVTDTEPGSSGSPVFNNEWQAIALHHWGGPWRQRQDKGGVLVPTDVNEGIRISAIVEELRQRSSETAGQARKKLSDLLLLGEVTNGLPATPGSDLTGGRQKIRVRDDGTVSWQLPIEISVGIPSLATMTTMPDVQTVAPVADTPRQESFRRTLDSNYDNRRGYREKFIPGHPVEMPQLSVALRKRAARNLDAEAGEDPFEFLFQHFSVVVDKVRRLPLFTACNIDGSTSKNISRTTGAITRAEAIVEEFDPGPEARERWYEDPRIDPKQATDDTLYTEQRVSAGSNRTGRIFHRGHMVRRLDPVWGSDARALRAEADTFHFTNCVPQIGVFNSRQALWQGIENYVLDNARAHDRRVCVFTGPIFDDANDPVFRDDLFPGFRVPMSFWKLVVWTDEFGLGSVCMIADQSGVIQELPEAAESRERFDDTAKIEEFVADIVEVESLTGLQFAEALHSAQLYDFTGPESARGRGRIPMRRIEDLNLKRSKDRKARRPAKKGASK